LLFIKYLLAAELATGTKGDFLMDNSKFKQVSNDGSGVLTVSVDNALVCSDIHVPGHSEYHIKKMIKYGLEHGIKHLFIAGDFWNHDAISRWELKDRNLGLADELKAGKELLHRLTKYFYVYLVCGNHDARMPRILKYAVSYSDWVATIHAKKLVVTDFDYMFLESDGEIFRICHPDMYSLVKNKSASTLAQDLQQHVIMGHQHYLSIATNKTGKYMAIDAGCMCDINAFVYKKASTTRCPEWENGFFHIKNGKVKMICDYTF
jgi:predicted phosphodiesterase